jgi:hypothetical protein
MELSTTPNSGIPAGLRKKAYDAIAGVLSADMAPEDWDGLREGLLKWIGEEEAEPEHAQDARLVLAMDREPQNRFVDDDGHLHVKENCISKAVVSPYLGSEIPDYQKLGLDPGKVYQLLRDPKELEKAAGSFNGKPLLSEHRPINARDHAPELVIGSVSNPVYEHPFLKAELVVWPQDAIDKIENGSKSNISCGYKYVVVMEPGDFEGAAFDGRMTQLVANHVSLVIDGRVPGAVVGDSQDTIIWERIASAIMRM